jgi:starvation-inducible DNA-binding protein
MDELVQQMKVCLASTFAFYLKGHNFHWNVEGPDFMQYHQLFEMLYADAWGAVDGLAEHIRALDAYAPGSLSRFSQLSVVDDQINIPSAMKMIRELQLDNDRLKGELVKGQRLAEAANETGLANFLQDRIDIHSKHAWMLRATLKA